MATNRDFFLQHAVASYDLNGSQIVVLEHPHNLYSAYQVAVEELVVKLHALTAKSFGVSLEQQAIDPFRDHVLNADHLTLLFLGNEVLGFASSKLFSSVNVCYLHGAAVNVNYKGKGAGKALLLACTKQSNMPYIAGTTQNPIVFLIMRSLCSTIYPIPEGQPIPPNIQQVGQVLVQGRIGILDSESFIIHGLYSERSMYDKIPLSSDKMINMWFKRSLGIKRGQSINGFLFIGLVKNKE